MPIPKPNKGESKDDFISRCMSFLDDENSELDQNQRVAACNAKWEDNRSMKFVKEPRTYKADFEVRFDSNKQPIIEGYVAVFESLSEDMMGFREKIAHGAFEPALKKDTYLFWNHNSDKVLARKKAGTLKLREDKKGLRIEAKLPEWAKDHIETITRKDVNGASFGFIAASDEWDHKKNIRTLTKISELPEVSIGVPFPAYSATDITVALRSRELSKSTGKAEPTLVKPDEIVPAPTRWHDSGDIRRDFKSYLQEVDE